MSSRRFVSRLRFIAVQSATTGHFSTLIAPTLLSICQRKRGYLLDMGHTPDGERPASTYARQIFSRLLIDLSWNSSRLEGNTYSLLETEAPVGTGRGCRRQGHRKRR